MGSESKTGIDLPGESAGRIADRKWKLSYWKANKDYYCKIGKKPGSDFLHVFAREFCTDGYALPGRRRGQLRDRPGRHAADAAPARGRVRRDLQRRHAVGAAGRQGRRQRRGPRGQADPADGQATCRSRTGYLHYIDQALLGTAKVGTMAWKMGGFPLDKVFIRSKTGTAEVYGKQTTSWVASYDKQYVVIMQISQAGTGSGASGDAVRRSGSRSTASTASRSSRRRRRAWCAPAHRSAGLPRQRRDQRAERPSHGRGVTCRGPDSQASRLATRTTRRVNVIDRRSVWVRMDWVW